MIAFDIETSGLEPKTDKFRAYSWSDGKSAARAAINDVLYRG